MHCLRCGAPVSSSGVYFAHSTEGGLLSRGQSTSVDGDARAFVLEEFKAWFELRAAIADLDRAAERKELEGQEQLEL